MASASENPAIFLRAIELQLQNIAENVLTTAQINIVKNNQVYRGEMFDSGHIEKPAQLTRQIIFDAPQSVWQEFGTHPHPISQKGKNAIARWAQVKLGLDEKEAMGLAWGYSVNVSREGTEPRPFLRPALDEVLIRGGFI